MKWSRFVHCAVIAGFTSVLAARGFSAWIVAPLAAIGMYWTFLCTRALWQVISFRIAGWRLRQAPSAPTDWASPRTVRRWEWLSNPQLDGLIDVATVVLVLLFPAILWTPLIALLAR